MRTPAALPFARTRSTRWDLAGGILYNNLEGSRTNPHIRSPLYILFSFFPSFFFPSESLVEFLSIPFGRTSSFTTMFSLFLTYILFLFDLCFALYNATRESIDFKLKELEMCSLHSIDLLDISSWRIGVGHVKEIGALILLAMYPMMRAGCVGPDEGAMEWRNMTEFTTC